MEKSEGRTLLPRTIHEGGDVLLGDSRGGTAVAAANLGGAGPGTLRRGCHPRFPCAARLLTADSLRRATSFKFNGAVQVESRMVFRFKDGSLYDETVVFTQERVFTMQSYRLVQRGPAFAEDTEISLERASGKYRVSTKAHKDGR